jgi:hypothetical protein
MLNLGMEPEQANVMAQRALEKMIAAQTPAPAPAPAAPAPAPAPPAPLTAVQTRAAEIEDELVNAGVAPDQAKIDALAKAQQEEVDDAAAKAEEEKNVVAESVAPKPESTEVVSTEPDVGEPATGEGQQPTTVAETPVAETPAETPLSPLEVARTKYLAASDIFEKASATLEAAKEADLSMLPTATKKAKKAIFDNLKKAKAAFEEAHANSTAAFEEFQKLNEPTEETPVAETPPAGIPPTRTLADVTAEIDAGMEEVKQLTQQQQALLTKAGRKPAAKSPAFAKWDALGAQIDAKKDAVGRLFIEEDKLKKEGAPSGTEAVETKQAEPQAQETEQW